MENLRREAREIASSGKSPRHVLAELRQWAAGKGPLAMKSAMIEFFSVHGTSSEAAMLMPDLIRNQVFTLAEKRQLLGPVAIKPPANSLSLKPAANPRTPILAFSPSSSRQLPPFGSPLSPNSDHVAMRDMHLTIHSRMQLSLGRPNPPAAFDPSKSPDTYAMVAAHKGEHIIRHLVEKMRTHASDHPVPVISGEVRPSKTARKTARKIAKKKARHPKKKPGKKKTRRK